MNEKAKLTDNIEPDEEAPDGLGGDLNRSSHLSSFEPRNNHMDSQVLQGVEQGGGAGVGVQGSAKHPISKYTIVGRLTLKQSSFNGRAED